MTPPYPMEISAEFPLISSTHYDLQRLTSKKHHIRLTRAPNGKNPQDSEVERIYSHARATLLVSKGSQKAGSNGCSIT